MPKDGIANVPSNPKMSVQHASTMFVVTMISVVAIITIIVLWITCACTRRKYEKGHLNTALWCLKIVYFGRVPALKESKDSEKLVANEPAGDETSC